MKLSQLQKNKINEYKERFIKETEQINIEEKKKLFSDLYRFFLKESKKNGIV